MTKFSRVLPFVLKFPLGPDHSSQQLLRGWRKSTPRIQRAL